MEKVEIIDNFFHPKHNKTSHCYRITYRHMEKVLTREEVNVLHKHIEDCAVLKLGVEIR